MKQRTLLILVLVGCVAASTAVLAQNSVEGAPSHTQQAPVLEAAESAAAGSALPTEPESTVAEPGDDPAEASLDSDPTLEPAETSLATEVTEPPAAADALAEMETEPAAAPLEEASAPAGIDPLRASQDVGGEAVPVARAGDSEWPSGAEVDAASAPAPTPDPSVLAGSLGAIGYDSKGRQGRVHIVVSADTLWDISNAYLGTPWVWPSIWKDNRDIENPHLIHPGDRIWITPFEMRRVSAQEAEALLGNAPEPAAAEEWVALEEIVPAAPDELPAPMPVLAPQELGTLDVSGLESVGLISQEELDASASIVGRVPDRMLLAQEDDVYVGLGESDVEVGDQFSIVRTREKVLDPDTGELLGYHVEKLGWLEIRETFPETARAAIRMSTGDIELKDRLIPREPVPDGVPMQPSPDGVEGKLSFFPKKRFLMGLNDFVYLNRGMLDGLEPGSPLEVYRLGFTASEETRHQQVEVPDRVIARLVVVRADTEASVAIVTHADGELELGDRFRGAR